MGVYPSREYSTDYRELDLTSDMNPMNIPEKEENARRTMHVCEFWRARTGPKLPFYQRAVETGRNYAAWKMGLKGSARCDPPADDQAKVWDEFRDAVEKDKKEREMIERRAQARGQLW